MATPRDMDIPIDFLHECLTVDFERGTLTWKERPSTHFAKPFYAAAWNKANAGKTIQTTDNGRIRFEITYNRKTYRLFAYRVVWAMGNGCWPSGLVDHRDGNSMNNALDNLRDVPHIDNVKNTAMSARNQSGVVGVHFDKKTNSWRAEIGHENKKIRIGRYENFDEAVRARKDAEIVYGYSSGHGREKVSHGYH